MKRLKSKKGAADAAALNASLPRELRAWVDDRVARGGVGTPSEYVPSLIREDRDRSSREERHGPELLGGLQRGAQAGDAAGRRRAEALDMLRFTFVQMRANIRRDHPAASEAEIERRLEEWKKSDESSHEV